MAVPSQTAVMSYGSILGLLFSLFIASAKAKIVNDCHLIDDDGSPVGEKSIYRGRNETKGWVGEPDTRGSMTIVTTCLVTLGLCVWTSIHVNVQIDRLPFYRLRHKVTTSIRALIFPNLVVEEAHDEWAEMIRLYEGLANLQHIQKNTPLALGKRTPSQEGAKAADPLPWSKRIPTWFMRSTGRLEKEEDPRYPFSKEICFFVVMRGLVRPGRNKGHMTTEKENPSPAVANAEKRVADAKAKVASAKDGVARAKDTVASDERRVVDAKRGVAGARDKVTDAKDIMADMKESVAAGKTGVNVAGAETDVATAEKKLAASKVNLADAKAAVKMANVQVNVAKAEVNLAKAELNVAKAEASAASAGADTNPKLAKTKANTKLTKANIKLTKAKAELAKARLPMFIITPEDFFNAYARNPDAFRKMVKDKEKDVLDKGNASNIAKLIIMAQVTKLVLQMIGRKAMGLSVAVLELHIFVRLLIAGLLYSYWWYKQLDVNEPMELDIGDRYWAPDPMWSYYPEEALKPTGLEPGFKARVLLLWAIFRQKLSPSRRFNTQYPGPAPTDDETKTLAPRTPAARWDDAVKQINAMRFSCEVSNFKPAELLVEVLPNPHPRPRDEETQQSEAAANESQLDMISEVPPRSASSPPAAPPYHPPHPGDARPGCKPLHPSLVTNANFDSKRRAMWFYIAYAGLHATVWSKEFFPSWYEKWIWRGACIAVAVVPVIALVLEHLAGLREKTLWKKEPTHDTEEKGGESGVGQRGGWGGAARAQKKKLRTVFTWLLEFVYLVASVALLGESFSILRAEDARTYVIRSWTAELPLGR